MHLDKLLVNNAEKIKVAAIGFALLFAITACKGKAANPALNFAPVPDGAPQNSYADLVAKVAPAVVTIRADRGQQPRETLQRAPGSGVIVSADGYILTNHHVIDGAKDIHVDLNDGRTLDAKLIGSDPPSDLALLKVNASSLPTLTPGDSDKVRVGDVALAIGNPFGVGQTVTMGIISAKGRSGPGLGSGNFEDFLQTD